MVVGKEWGRYLKFKGRLEEEAWSFAQCKIRVLITVLECEVSS